MQHKNEALSLAQQITQFVENQQIWILTDEYGSVMLTTEDEDCIPVWLSKIDAEKWATEDWQGFEAVVITLSTWLNKWTDGLGDDELAIVINPQQEIDGLVISPFEFAELLQKERKNK